MGKMYKQLKENKNVNAMENMERCCTKLVVGNCKLKLFWDPISHILDWLKSKSLAISSVGKDE